MPMNRFLQNPKIRYLIALIASLLLLAVLGWRIYLLWERYIEMRHAIFGYSGYDPRKTTVVHICLHSFGFLCSLVYLASFLTKLKRVLYYSFLSICFFSLAHVVFTGLVILHPGGVSGMHLPRFKEIVIYFIGLPLLHTFLLVLLFQGIRAIRKQLKS